MNIKVGVAFLINIGFMSFLLFLFIFQSWKCVDHYLAKETGVQMSVGRADMMRFPSIALSTGWNETAIGKIEC